MMSVADSQARLGQLFSGLDAAHADIRVSDITTHSANVAAGGLFLACQGYNGHGLDHLDKALGAKPAVVAWEPGAAIAEPELPDDVVGLRVAGLGAQVGEIADRFFGQPSVQLRVTGVTGTNGKTTTAWLAAHALQRLGQQAAYMGTLGYGIGDRLADTQLTTPPCITVHRRLRELAAQGAACVVMEVSSHGLDQGRIDGVHIRSAAFTNLSRDHLDYHGDMAAYGRAKATLFRRSGLESAVVNIGDNFGRELAASLDNNIDLISVALGNADAASRARLRAELLATGPAGLRLRFSGDFGTAELVSPMWGAFNAENLLVAAGILLAQGFALDAVVGALSHCAAPPGRMQVVRGQDRPLAVVDFAHTPDALGKALQAVREHCDGRVWVVFGCGGERDQGKRAQMAAIAEQFADCVVVTSDNPRREDPQAIVDAVCAGLTAPAEVHVELDRAAAIRFALDSAAANDAVLIAGKGSEDYQLIGDQRLQFSDIAVATGYLQGAAS